MLYCEGANNCGLKYLFCNLDFFITLSLTYHKVTIRLSRPLTNKRKQKLFLLIVFLSLLFNSFFCLFCKVSLNPSADK